MPMLMIILEPIRAPHKKKDRGLFPAEITANQSRDLVSWKSSSLRSKRDAMMNVPKFSKMCTLTLRAFPAENRKKENSACEINAMKICKRNIYDAEGKRKETTETCRFQHVVILRRASHEVSMADG